MPNPTKSRTKSAPTQNEAGRGKGRSEQDQGRGQSQELAPPSREEAGGRTVNPFVPGGPGNEASASFPPTPLPRHKERPPSPDLRCALPWSSDAPKPLSRPFGQADLFNLPWKKITWGGGGEIGIYIMLQIQKMYSIPSPK